MDAPSLIDRMLSRRRLVTGMAGVAGLSAVHPAFVPFARTGQAAAQRATPVPEDQQVLRFGSCRLGTRLTMRAPGDFIGTFTQSIALTPFIPDNAGQLTPGLCLDYTVSADGLTYVLNLDPQARFSDGAKITAGDLKFTWDYMASPAAAYPFHAYSTFMIAGYDAVVAGTAPEFSGLTVLNDDALQVQLSRPFTPFPYYLSNYFQGVYKQTDIETSGEEWDQRPFAASGPYMPESYNPDTDEGVLVRNPYWWRETPRIARIEHRPSPDPNTMLVLWDNDEIDGFFYINIPAQFAESGEGQYLVEVPEFESGWFNLSTVTAPTDDLQVRRALLLATDVDSVIPAVSLGDFAPAYGITPPSIPGTRQRESFFDPAAARAALASSTYGGPENLPPLIWAVGPNTFQSQTAPALAEIWREVLGVEVEILPVTSGVDPAEAGAQITYGANGNTYDAPGVFLTWGWHATNTWFQDRIGLVDQEIEDLLILAESLPLDDTPDGAAEPFNRAEDLILERAYAIPHHHKQQRHAVKPWVQNYEFNPTLNALVWNAFIAER